jgi:hypothetical protein
MSAEQFYLAFKISLPQITFCEVRCLELLLPPPGSDVYLIMFRMLGNLSLLQLNLVMEGDSVDGEEFMALMTLWGPSLPWLEILRIKYKFSKLEDVSNASILFMFLNERFRKILRSPYPAPFAAPRGEHALKVSPHFAFYTSTHLFC